MEIKVPKERILLLEDQLSDEEAEKIAWKNKINAFGAFHQVSSFLNRPKDNDFSITYKEHRYLPFLHILGSSTYVYDRKVTHEWPVSGSEVQQITLQNKEYDVKNERVSIDVMEHCRDDSQEELFVDGLSSVRSNELEKYLAFSSKDMQKEDLEKLAKTSTVIPPQARTSSLVREIGSKMIRTIEADTIFEENIEFHKVDIYYHSLFAYCFSWNSKSKESTVLVDGLTGEVSFVKDDFKRLVGNVFDYDFLFDIGKDAASMFIPGGAIAIKLAKKYIDSTKQQKKANF